MMPASHGCSLEVVFGVKKTKLDVRQLYIRVRRAIVYEHQDVTLLKPETVNGILLNINKMCKFNKVATFTCTDYCRQKVSHTKHIPHFSCSHACIVCMLRL